MSVSSVSYREKRGMTFVDIASVEKALQALTDNQRKLAEQLNLQQLPNSHYLLSFGQGDDGDYLERELADTLHIDRDLFEVTVDLAIDTIVDGRRIVDFDEISRRLRGIAFDTRQSSATIVNAILGNQWHKENQLQTSTPPIQECVAGSLTGTDIAIISLDLRQATMGEVDTKPQQFSRASSQHVAQIDCGNIADSQRPIVRISLHPDGPENIPFTTPSARAYPRKLAHSIVNRFGF